MSAPPLRFPAVALLKNGFLKSHCTEAVQWTCAECGGLRTNDGRACGTCFRVTAPISVCATCRERLSASIGPHPRACLSQQAYEGDLNRAPIFSRPEQVLWALKVTKDAALEVIDEADLERRLAAGTLSSAVLVSRDFGNSWKLAWETPGVAAATCRAPATGLPGVTSSSLTISAGTATAAAITTQPTGAVSGSVLGTQPVIRLVDASGTTVTSSSVNVVASIASGTGTLSGTTTVAASAGVATFTNLVITGTAGSFTVTFTPTGLTPVTSSSLTITAAVVYAVGDTGPGGGIVFYVASGTFTQTGATGSMCTNTCKYLEAAPTNWLSGTVGDPRRPWSTGANQSTAVSGADATGIGSGYQN